jgi:hypothetical protein
MLTKQTSSPPMLLNRRPLDTRFKNTCRRVQALTTQLGGAPRPVEAEADSVAIWGLLHRVL